ncbi:MAG: winged helix-turn-helix domain-containing protein [Candidatus Aenigmarchaeota archaeon]|nr:winged helix-turn-helix domain-containing protein [Candidatus Aenigmarchaeota archaeon]
MKRRSKLLILMDILNIIQREDGKAKPTHIMYGANLSHSSLKEYLSLLLSNDFIEEVKKNDRTFYKLTPKGYDHINELRKVKRLTEAFGIPM